MKLGQSLPSSTERRVTGSRLAWYKVGSTPYEYGIVKTARQQASEAARQPCSANVSAEPHHVITEAELPF